MSSLARVLTGTTKPANSQDLQAAVQRPSTLAVGRSCALAWLGVAVAAQHPYTRCPSADAPALTAFPLYGRQSSCCTCCQSFKAECRRRHHSLSCTQVVLHPGETRLHGASHSQTAGDRAQSASPAPPWPWSPIGPDPPPGPPCPAWRRHASATPNRRPHRLMGRCLQHGTVLSALQHVLLREALGPSPRPKTCRCTVHPMQLLLDPKVLCTSTVSFCKAPTSVCAAAGRVQSGCRQQAQQSRGSLCFATGHLG